MQLHTLESAFQKSVQMLGQNPDPDPRDPVKERKIFKFGERGWGQLSKIGDRVRGCIRYFSCKLQLFCWETTIFHVQSWSGTKILNLNELK